MTKMDDIEREMREFRRDADARAAAADAEIWRERDMAERQRPRTFGEAAYRTWSSIWGLVFTFVWFAVVFVFCVLVHMWQVSAQWLAGVLGMSVSHAGLVVYVLFVVTVGVVFSWLTRETAARNRARRLSRKMSRW